MSFDTLGAGGLDYLPCQYGTSKVLFRGPQKSLEAPYVAFFGGTETYGKFIEKPFPDLIGAEVAATCINFGVLNAGLDLYVQDAFLRNVASNAPVTVLQVTSPRNMSNRFYTVHPRRNDRFVKPSVLLKAIYREVDFSQFNFTRHLLQHLQAVSPDRFKSIIEELREAWIARMRLLLGQMPGKTILLWFADHAPSARRDTTGADPWFVTQGMIDEIRGLVTDYVEVIPTLSARNTGTDGMIYADMERPAAAQMMGPAAHIEAAQKLRGAVKRLIQ
ncbi:MAG: DUF6473 family protein [Pseudomonadota bacterium]